jgi:hypothetical protein
MLKQRPQFFLAAALLLAASWWHNGCSVEGINPLHDTKSDVFKALAKETYAKVLPCVQNAHILKDKNVKWAFPDDAEEHYELIKNKTSPYRTAPVHEYAGYEGPWIENIFITEYMHRPLHSFSGLIPIFVQWIDNQILRGRYFDYIFYELKDLLRPNVLYLAVSQGDVGLGKIAFANPNILVLSAGGFGHVPLPLIKGELPTTPLPTKWEQDIGFFGTIRQATRPEMLGLVETTATGLNMTYRHGSGSSWQHDMAHTKFNLAPRGYGRSSFRFAESVHLGRVPVFMYNDHPWVPYMGTNFSIETYGFVAGLVDGGANTMVEMVTNLSTVSMHDYKRLQGGIDAVRHAFTYPGVMREIELFLTDPFGVDGGHLRCTYHPHTERCCG